jgi:hypothetical protein
MQNMKKIGFVLVLIIALLVSGSSGFCDEAKQQKKIKMRSGQPDCRFKTEWPVSARPASGFQS